MTNETETNDKEPTDTEIDAFLDEMGEQAHEVMDAMLDACCWKLNEFGVCDSIIDHVSETLFHCDTTYHEIWEDIWNALIT